MPQATTTLGPVRVQPGEQLPHSAIAQLLAISEAAVGKRISRARGRLAKELEKAERRRTLLVQAATKEGKIK